MLLSLDISTSCTGYSLFDQNQLVKIGHVDLTKKEGLFEKSKHIKDELLKLKEAFNISHIIVEENLQAFRPGLSSAKTLLTLAQFNGVVRWICFENICASIESINVNTARKSVGLKIDKSITKTTKEQVLEWVSSDCQELHWPIKTVKSGRNKGQVIIDPVSYDMADSYVIGKAYYKINSEII